MLECFSINFSWLNFFFFFFFDFIFLIKTFWNFFFLNKISFELGTNNSCLKNLLLLICSLFLSGTVTIFFFFNFCPFSYYEQFFFIEKGCVLCSTFVKLSTGSLNLLLNVAYFLLSDLYILSASCFNFSSLWKSYTSLNSSLFKLFDSICSGVRPYFTGIRPYQT